MPGVTIWVLDDLRCNVSVSGTEIRVELLEAGALRQERFANSADDALRVAELWKAENARKRPAKPRPPRAAAPSPRPATQGVKSNRTVAVPRVVWID